MIRFEHVEVTNWHAANRGMRNSFESWAAIDSYYDVPANAAVDPATGRVEGLRWVYGPNDYSLACRLARAGKSHAKFRRQILVSVDITAPLYFFKQLDQYKVGVVTNSTSTMHTIQRAPFVPEMFSVEGLDGYRRKVEHRPNPMDECTEVWREHPTHHQYEVSDQGRVKRKAYTTPHSHRLDEKILKNIVQHDGYVRVNIALEDGSRKSYPTHRLVAETFIPNPDAKPEVNHRDGNRQHNAVSNLEWVTRSENAKHAHDSGLQVMSGLTAKRISLANSRFTAEQRAEIIRQHAEEGLSRRELARRHGVSHTCICDIINSDYRRVELTAFDHFVNYLDALNEVRKKFLDTKDRHYWRMLIQMLPDSFNQTRTVTMNYEVLHTMFHDRKGHRLSEWSTEFVEWVRGLPYSELITLDGLTKEAK